MKPISQDYKGGESYTAHLVQELSIVYLECLELQIEVCIADLICTETCITLISIFGIYEARDCLSYFA